MNKFTELIESSAGSALARQLAFGDFLGTHNWEVDTQTGRVDFGKKRVYPIQILGTENERDGTWLWAWANTVSGLPDSVVALSVRVRDHGVARGIPELTNRKFDLDNLTGHAVALACAGLVGRLPYYRGPYDGGAVFFYVLDTPAAVSAPVSALRASTVIQQLVSDFEVHHERAVMAFLVGEGLTIETSEASLLGRWPHGDEIRIDFDQQGRVARINTQASQSPAAKRPWWKRKG